MWGDDFHKKKFKFSKNFTFWKPASNTPSDQRNTNEQLVLVSATYKNHLQLQFWFVFSSQIRKKYIPNFLTAAAATQWTATRASISTVTLLSNGQIVYLQTDNLWTFRLANSRTYRSVLICLRTRARAVNLEISHVLLADLLINAL